MTEQGSTQPAGAANSNPDADDDSMTREEFLALIARAEKGGEQAQAELCRFLDANPALWKLLGDLGDIVERQLIALVTRSSFVMAEALRRRLAELRDQLGNGDRGPLMGLLIHRVVVSWLEVEVRQIQALQAQTEPSNRKHQGRLDSAQRRHLESLAALRDFQRPLAASENVNAPMPPQPTAPAALNIASSAPLVSA